MLTFIVLLLLFYALLHIITKKYPDKITNRYLEQNNYTDKRGNTSFPDSLLFQNIKVTSVELALAKDKHEVLFLTADRNNICFDLSLLILKKKQGGPRYLHYLNDHNLDKKRPMDEFVKSSIKKENIHVFNNGFSKEKEDYLIKKYSGYYLEIAEHVIILGLINRSFSVYDIQELIKFGDEVNRVL